MYPVKKKHQGSALLTALFIMTLVAIVATAMSAKLQMDIYRTQLILAHDRLYLSSQGVAFWALGTLNDTKQQFFKADEKGMVSTYPKKMERIYPLVVVQGGLYDAQSLYNLNNLINPKATIGFLTLVRYAAVHIESNERARIAQAIKDWLSAYDLARGEDAFLSYYIKLKPPYFPSHQPMSSASELRLVKDVDAKAYQAIIPFVTALPEITPININTATKLALISLSEAMNEKRAEEIIKARGNKGIKHIEKISELLKKLNIANESITLESSYFLSIANANSNNMRLTVYTLFKRSKDKKGKLTARILRQSFNVF